jgi:hypothetical protein
VTSPPPDYLALMFEGIPNLDGQIEMESMIMGGGGTADIYRGKWRDPERINPSRLAIKVFRNMEWNKEREKWLEKESLRHRLRVTT